jgi:hypothetical protein
MSEMSGISGQLPPHFGSGAFHRRLSGAGGSHCGVWRPHRGRWTQKLSSAENVRKARISTQHKAHAACTCADTTSIGVQLGSL